LKARKLQKKILNRSGFGKVKGIKVMRKDEHGGNLSKMVKHSGLSMDKIVDFSVNINPQGLPPQIKKLVTDNISSLSRYPQPKSESLKNEIAKMYKIRPDNLIIGNGSIELIYLIPQALKIKNALIITPTFSEYEAAARLYGAKIEFLAAGEKDDFKVDFVKLAKLIPKTEIVFICNPNNPTGTMLTKEEMRRLMNMCERNRVFLAVDEAFMDFADNNAGQFSLLREVRWNRYLFVIRSLTKFFALAGLRLGYIAAHPRLAKRLVAFQYPWNVNVPAQVIGQEMIKDNGYIKKSREFIRREKRFLIQKLAKISGIKIYPAAANFIFCKLEQHCRAKSAAALCEQLAKEAVIIRDCGNFRGLNNKFFRVAVKARKDNIRLIAALKKVC